MARETRALPNPTAWFRLIRDSGQPAAPALPSLKINTKLFAPAPCRENKKARTKLVRAFR